MSRMYLKVLNFITVLFSSCKGTPIDIIKYREKESGSCTREKSAHAPITNNTADWEIKIHHRVQIILSNSVTLPTLTNTSVHHQLNTHYQHLIPPISILYHLSKSRVHHTARVNTHLATYPQDGKQSTAAGKYAISKWVRERIVRISLATLHCVIVLANTKWRHSKPLKTIAVTDSLMSWSLIIRSA